MRYKPSDLGDGAHVFYRLVSLIALLLCFNAPKARARIGESLDRCIELYGKPAQSQGKGVLFIKNGMRIYVTFNHGLADCIFLQKLDAIAPKRALPMPAPEIMRFLTENSCGCVWKYSSTLPDGDEIWITKESELGALYSQATCSLQVYTRENIVR
ncbi:MAG: hypothetical protein DVB28_001293 [Verrucomicrobia bacterium]|nr:MAG: hypothetical protein DVB28_001293 [Verrucomicrobiota bacterium]